MHIKHHTHEDSTSTHQYLHVSHTHLTHWYLHENLLLRIAHASYALVLARILLLRSLAHLSRTVVCVFSCTWVYGLGFRLVFGV
jgi:hypothetical protein